MGNRIVRLGLAAAAVGVAVGVIALLGINLLPGGGTGAQPTPSPTLTLPWPGTTPQPDVSDHGTVQNGLLDPGTYNYIDVDGADFNVRFTVPAGWTWHGRYLSKGGVGLPDGAAIFFFGGPVQVYADPCHWAGPWENPPSGPTASDLMAALAAQPMRSATTPTYPSMSGWGGMAVELTVPNKMNFADCDRGQFRSWGSGPKTRSHQGPGQRDLVWAVNLSGNGVESGGQRLIIDAASFPGTPADVISEMEAILESIHAGSWG